jgi:hypothetical protein
VGEREVMERALNRAERSRRGIALSGENRHRPWFPTDFAACSPPITDGPELMYESMVDCYSSECDRSMRFDARAIGVEGPFAEVRE